jgi:membrane-bound metal-dependent hydrolase YbcI (DUF457 family)
MNAATHSLVAFATVTTLSAVEEHHHGQATIRPLGDGILGALLASLPDKLEPPIHPNHRQFFHSVAFATCVGYVTYRAYKSEPTEDWERIVRWVLVIGGVAYLTHLVLDACTKKGLPPIGKF